MPSTSTPDRCYACDAPAAATPARDCRVPACDQHRDDPVLDLDVLQLLELHEAYQRALARVLQHRLVSIDRENVRRLEARAAGDREELLRLAVNLSVDWSER